MSNNSIKLTSYAVRSVNKGRTEEWEGDVLDILRSNNIPFEVSGDGVYLISKEAYDAGVEIKSGNYEKPYSKFCLSLADSFESSISMGEAPINKDHLPLLYNLFQTNLLFDIIFSNNSEIESLECKITHNKEEDSYHFESIPAP